jgi:Xaa-Pro aminopeptidase
MKKTLYILYILAISLSSNAQINPNLYDTDRLSPAFHAGRRAALREKMPNKSVTVVFANPERQRNNDTDFQYAQNPNLYYLTGYPEPNAVLVVSKEEIEMNGMKGTEFFFVQDRNPRMEVWTGRRLGKEGTQTQLGIVPTGIGKDFVNSSLDFSQFDKILTQIPTGLADGGFGTDAGHLSKLVASFQNKTKDIKAKIDNRLYQNYLSELREIKQAEEMPLLRKAIDISVLGHIESMKFVEAGVTEYQAQSVMEYVFKSNGSEYVGYPSICGGAENACILHYISNRRKLEQQDMFLSDCGAEYHGYTADITRTVPVSGKFSAEQKAIYEIVLKAQDAGIAVCKEGNPFGGTHEAAFKVVAEELQRLGIIKDKNEAYRYFMHGTSHFLGLDVHDWGVSQTLKVGHVLTVEPGIYIPANSPCDAKWWNIGVRIEDDILITPTGNENLSKAAPRTVADIEKMMAEKSRFKK